MKRENFERAQELYDFIDDEKQQLKNIEEILKDRERLERKCESLQVSMDFCEHIIYFDADVALVALAAQKEKTKEHIRIAEEEMESL